ncbi:hypothetical protein Bca4012_093199 [Brassica carinata]
MEVVLSSPPPPTFNISKLRVKEFSSVLTINNSSKRGCGQPTGSGKKQRLSSTVKQTLSEIKNQDSLMCELMMPSSSGMSFTPHMIVVSIGEDIASKVIAFSQQVDNVWRKRGNMKVKPLQVLAVVAALEFLIFTTSVKSISLMQLL